MSSLSAGSSDLSSPELALLNVLDDSFLNNAVIGEDPSFFQDLQQQPPTPQVNYNGNYQVAAYQTTTQPAVQVQEVPQMFTGGLVNQIPAPMETNVISPAPNSRFVPSLGGTNLTTILFQVISDWETITKDADPELCIYLWSTLGRKIQGLPSNQMSSMASVVSGPPPGTPQGSGSPPQPAMPPPQQVVHSTASPPAGLVPQQQQQDRPGQVTISLVPPTSQVNYNNNSVVAGQSTAPPVVQQVLHLQQGGAVHQSHQHLQPAGAAHQPHQQGPVVLSRVSKSLNGLPGKSISTNAIYVSLDRDLNQTTKLVSMELFVNCAHEGTSVLIDRDSLSILKIVTYSANLSVPKVYSMYNLYVKYKNSVEKFTLKNCLCPFETSDTVLIFDSTYFLVLVNHIPDCALSSKRAFYQSQAESNSLRRRLEKMDRMFYIRPNSNLLRAMNKGVKPLPSTHLVPMKKTFCSKLLQKFRIANSGWNRKFVPVQDLADLSTPMLLYKTGYNPCSKIKFLLYVCSYVFLTRAVRKA